MIYYKASYPFRSMLGCFLNFCSLFVLPKVWDFTNIQELKNKPPKTGGLLYLLREPFQNITVQCKSSLFILSIPAAPNHHNPNRENNGKTKNHRIFSHRSLWQHFIIEYAFQLYSFLRKAFLKRRYLASTPHTAQTDNSNRLSRPSYRLSICPR